MVIYTIKHSEIASGPPVPDELHQYISLTQWVAICKAIRQAFALQGIWKSPVKTCCLFPYILCYHPFFIHQELAKTAKQLNNALFQEHHVLSVNRCDMLLDTSRLPAPCSPIYEISIAETAQKAFSVKYQNHVEAELPTT